MTAPRQVLPGLTYVVNRRCSQRQFLLTPSSTTNQVFLYVLAVAVERYRMELHAFCVMSNHYHLVVTDPHANLPGFQQYLDALVARAINASLGRWEAFWGPDSYSAVVLTTPESIVEKAAYVLANPVAAGLVRRGSEWPGLWSAPERIGGEAIDVEKPAHFFSPTGALPAKAQLRLTRPPGFESNEAFRHPLTTSLAASEEAARAVIDAAGGPVGVARVLAQDPLGQPATHAPHRGLKPRVAGRDEWKRREVLGRLKGFLVAYREAWSARAAGKLETVFPAGTYLMRVLHGAPCAASG